MSAKLLEYLRHPGFLLGLMTLVSIMVVCVGAMRKVSWKRKVLGGLAIFGMLGLIWFLSGLW